nr:META domain-containing protein [Spirosoma montaniterrae]
MWTLETFRGQRLRPEQFGDKMLPTLEFDLKTGKLTGSTGWSKLKGDIRANADQLTIDPKTNPRPANPFETSFVDALRQVSLFRVSQNRLTLLVDGQYVMTLRRT